MIRNLLFDLGGVIMDIERSRCVEAFRELGLENADHMLGVASQKGAFGQLEEGSIDACTFRAEIRAAIGRPVSDAVIDAAFTRFLIGIPRKRLEYLRSLRGRYGIYMLSNTNPIMWNGFIAEQFRQEGRDINAYFDGIVTSFEAKCMKPDPRIFGYAASHLGIDPAETLFLDDAEVNCRAAVGLGWHSAHVKPGREFIDVLRELNLAGNE